MTYISEYSFSFVLWIKLVNHFVYINDGKLIWRLLKFKFQILFFWLAENNTKKEFSSQSFFYCPELDTVSPKSFSKTRLIKTSPVQITHCLKMSLFYIVIKGKGSCSPVLPKVNQFSPWYFSLKWIPMQVGSRSNEVHTHKKNYKIYQHSLFIDRIKIKQGFQAL